MNRASFLKRIAMAMAASALFEVEWPEESPLDYLEDGTYYVSYDLTHAEIIGVIKARAQREAAFLHALPETPLTGRSMAFAIRRC